MPLWKEKERRSPFELQPIDGLFFLDGAFFAQKQHPAPAIEYWKERNITELRTWKAPMIAFPSGAICELWNSSDPTNAVVHLFGEIDILLKNTSRDETLPYIQDTARSCNYSAQPISEDAIEVSGGKAGEHVIITFNNTERHVSNIEFIGERPAEEFTTTAP